MAFLAFSLALTSCAGEQDEPELTANPEALAAFETATELWSTPGVTRAQFDEVIAGYEHAIELDPDEPAAHAAMGAYYYRIAKDYPAAIESYDRAEALEPGDVATIRMTGCIARRDGRLDEAIERLVRADGSPSPFTRHPSPPRFARHTATALPGPRPVAARPRIRSRALPRARSDAALRPR